MNTSRKPIKFVAESELREDFDRLLALSPVGTTKIGLLRALVRDQLARIEKGRDIIPIATIEQKIDRLSSICCGMERNNSKTGEIMMRIYNMVILLLEAVERGVSVLIGMLVQSTKIENFSEIEQKSKATANDRTLAKYMISQKKTKNIITRLKGKTEYKWIDGASKNGMKYSEYTNGETIIFVINEYQYKGKDGITNTGFIADIEANGTTYQLRQTSKTMEEAQKYIEPLKNKIIKFVDC